MINSSLIKLDRLGKIKELSKLYLALSVKDFATELE